MPGAHHRRQRRQQAVELAGSAGVQAAAVEYGVAPETIRRWAAAVGVELPAAVEAVEAIEAVEPPAPQEQPAPPEPQKPSPQPQAPAVDDDDDAPLPDRLRAQGAEYRRIAQEAVSQVERLLAAGRAGDARNAAVSAGVLLDKARQADEQARVEEEHSSRLAAAEGQLLAAAVTHALEALELGASATAAMRRLIAQLLRQAGAGNPLATPQPEAQAARSAVRQHIAAELREELEREFRSRIEPPWRAQRLALPAASEAPAEPAPMAGPRRVVRTDVEGGEDDSQEHVPRRLLEAYGGSERLARLAMREAKRRERARLEVERRRPGALSGWAPSRWPRFDMPARP